MFLDFVEDLWIALPVWLRLTLSPFILILGIVAGVFLFLPFMIFGAMWTVCRELAQVDEE